MKKLTAFLAFCLFTFSFCLASYAGQWTANGYLYKPSLGASGPTEYNLFNQGFNQVDVRLGKQLWTGDPAIAAALGAPQVEYITALESALAAIGTTPCTLHIPPGTNTLIAAVTIPSNIELRPERGALFIPGKYNLTINGSFQAGRYQVFSCTGTGQVLFGTQWNRGMIAEVYPEWWANNTGQDMSAAFMAAINSTGAANDSQYGPVPIIKLAQGAYAVNLNITNANFGTITGCGQDPNGDQYARGTSLIPANPALPVLEFGANCAYWTFNDFTINSPDTTGNYGVYYNGGENNFIWNRVTIQRFQGTPGYGAYNATGSAGKRYHECYFIYNNTGTYDQDNCQGTVYDGCEWHGNIGVQAYINGGPTVIMTFTNCDIENGGATSGTGNGLEAHNVYGINIDNMYTETHASAQLAFKFVNCGPVKISGLYGTGNGTATNYISIDSTSYVSIRDSYIVGTTGAPILGNAQISNTYLSGYQGDVYYNPNGSGTFNGYGMVGGANPYNGSILLGSNPSAQGIIDYNYATNTMNLGFAGNGTVAMGNNIAQKLMVSGTGGPTSPNGIYTYAGQHNNKPYYTCGSWYVLWSSAGYWVITTSLSNPFSVADWNVASTASLPPTGSYPSNGAPATGTAVLSAPPQVIVDSNGNLMVAGALTVTGAVSTPLSPGSTVAITASAGTTYTLTPAQAESITVSGGVEAQDLYLLITTSGATSYTLTFSTGFHSAGTLATGTATGAVFVVHFKDIGGTFYEVSRTAAM